MQLYIVFKYMSIILLHVTINPVQVYHDIDMQLYIDSLQVSIAILYHVPIFIVFKQKIYIQYATSCHFVNLFSYLYTNPVSSKSIIYFIIAICACRYIVHAYDNVWYVWSFDYLSLCIVKRHCLNVSLNVLPCN